MRIPTTSTPCASGPTVGGLPAVDCPPITPVPYSYDVGVGWAEDVAGPGTGYAIVLGVPTGVGGITPTPAAPVTGAIAFALPLSPITGAPTQEDIPGSWETAAEGIPDFVQLPVNVDQLPFGAGVPFWLRLEITDGSGCVTTGYAYFPDGLPSQEDSPADLLAYVAINERDFEALTADATEGEDGFPVDTFAVEDEPGVCPSTGQAVAVAQACGIPWDVNVADGLRVQGMESTEDFDPTPIPVTVPDPLPVTFETAEPTEASVDTNNIGTDDTQTILGGASSLVIHLRFQTPGAGSVLFGDALDFRGSDGLNSETIYLNAPPGKVLPDIEVTTTGGAVISWVAVG